jgi:hypothetical protein
VQNIQILKEVCQTVRSSPMAEAGLYFQFLTVTHDKLEIWFKYKLLTKVRNNLIPRSSRLGISLVPDGQI